NFSFIFNASENKWNLAPAYDLTYPLDALKNYLRVTRACAINGKRTEITLSDILSVAETYSIKNPKGIIQEVNRTAKKFRTQAQQQNLPDKVIDRIEKYFLLPE